MRLRIELSGGDVPGTQVFEFFGGPVNLGRSPKNHVAFGNQLVSRTHVSFDLVHGAWHVSHKGSMTPTLLNGMQLEPGRPTRVSDGDLVSVDTYVMRVAVTAQSDEAEPPPTMFAGDMPTAYGSPQTLSPLPADSLSDSNWGSPAAAPSFDAPPARPAPPPAYAPPPAAPMAGARPGPAGRGVPTLVATLDGEELRLELAETGRAYVLGRSTTADLTLGSTSISRQHCKVRFDGVTVYVSDLGARNPVLVNGRPIMGESPLSAGDVLTVGPAEVRLLTQSGATGGAPPSMGPGTMPMGAGGASWGTVEVAPHPAPGGRPGQPAGMPEWNPQDASGPAWTPPGESVPGAAWGDSKRAPSSGPAWTPPPVKSAPSAPVPRWDDPGTAAPPPAAPAAPQWTPPPVGGAPKPTVPTWGTPAPPPPPAMPKAPAAPAPPPPPPPVMPQIPKIPAVPAAPPPPAAPAAPLPPPPSASVSGASMLSDDTRVVVHRGPTGKGWLICGITCMSLALLVGIVYVALA